MCIRDRKLWFITSICVKITGMPGDGSICVKITGMPGDGGQNTFGTSLKRLQQLQTSLFHSFSEEPTSWFFFPFVVFFLPFSSDLLSTCTVFFVFSPLLLISFLSDLFSIYYCRFFVVTAAAVCNISTAVQRCWCTRVKSILRCLRLACDGNKMDDTRFAPYPPNPVLSRQNVARTTLYQVDCTR